MEEKAPIISKLLEKKRERFPTHFIKQDGLGVKTWRAGYEHKHRCKNPQKYTSKLNRAIYIYKKKGQYILTKKSLFQKCKADLTLEKKSINVIKLTFSEKKRVGEKSYNHLNRHKKNMW